MPYGSYQRSAGVYGQSTEYTGNYQMPQYGSNTYNRRILNPWILATTLLVVLIIVLFLISTSGSLIPKSTPSSVMNSLNQNSGRSMIPGVNAEDVSKWNKAFSWGDHREAGYLKQESDPLYSSSPASKITDEDLKKIQDTYSWGNHMTAGYLKAYTETDPKYTASPASKITDEDLKKIRDAYSWGNHMTAGYLKAYTETDPKYSSSPASTITSSDINNWNSKEPALATGNSSQFLRGDKTWQTVPTCPINSALLWNGTNFVCQDFMFNTNNLRLGTNAGLSITEGVWNTFIGETSGNKNTTGSWNTFVGNKSGYNNTTGEGNAFIGFRSGYSNTTGKQNTFVGEHSGHDNTTGSWNTFVGNKSGYKNTTGEGNVFMGFGSGYSNTTGKQNTFVGEHSGHDNTTGNWNTFVGNKSGYKNTTGVGNVFMGFGSGYTNTTASLNTFIGELSGNKNTTGGSNTFVGNKSGYNNTTGEGNVFMGVRSGYSNTTGFQNTFIGELSGEKNTTGRWNTFLGNQSGYNNTTGEWNLFLGFRSGTQNTTGNWNTFVGNQSGLSNTTGFSNVFVGSVSGHHNTTGERNVFVGDLSGFHNTIGSYNTFIGPETGRYYGSGSNANTSSSFTILIGHDVRPQNDNQTNQIVIGNQAIGAGSNTTTIGNTSVTSTYLRGSLIASDNITGGTTRVDIAGTGTGWAVCHSGSATDTDDVFLVDCTSTPSADYMEMYPVESNAQIGDILMTSNDYVLTQDNERIVKLVRSNGIHNTRVIGIMSDINKAGDFNSIGHNINASDNPHPVALSGRVYVNIDPSSPDIEPGDMITISNIPGKGKKLTSSGFVVGKALEAWSSASGQTRVMVYIMNFYYNASGINDFFTLSGTTLTTDYSLVVNGGITVNSLSLASGKFTVASNGNTVIDAVLQASQAVIGNLMVDKLSVNTSPLVGDPVIGSGVIPVGAYTVFINNSNVSSDSKIFISIKSSSSNFDTIAISSISPGVGFEVRIKEVNNDQETVFDYWIVN